MGKIVKFCSSCDEGFAEKFGFCPNCGQPLQGFEMNPIIPAAPVVKEVAAAPVAVPFVAEAIKPVVAPVEAVLEAAPVAETFIEPVIEPVEEAVEVVQVAAPVAETFVEPVVEPIIEPVETPTEVIQMAAPVTQTLIEPEVEEAIVEEPVIEEPVVAKPVETPVVKAPARKAAAATVAPFVQKTVIDVDRKPASHAAAPAAFEDDGAFHVTVIEEKNVGQRRLLLLGAFSFIVFTLMTGLVYNLFSKDLDVSSINDDIFNAVLVDLEPMTVEEEMQQKKDKSAGGGGGGGREEEETTQGDLANQTKNPERPPQAVPRLENPELTLPPASTQGNKTFEQKFDRFGDPNGRFTNWNNGTGSGGGQGSGAGTGQGSGRGTGAGSGIGSGYGSGIGNGNGGGVGDGDDGPPPPPRPVGVTQGLKILSKPRPGYTDAARTNNIQGTVILRVTFLASGQIGSISAVKGLPNGLTEQAIAAARRISFEPAKRDGQGQSVTKQIEYSFSIY